MKITDRKSTKIFNGETNVKIYETGDPSVWLSLWEVHVSERNVQLHNNTVIKFIHCTHSCILLYSVFIFMASWGASSITTRSSGAGIIFRLMWQNIYNHTFIFLLVYQVKEVNLSKYTNTIPGCIIQILSMLPANSTSNWQHCLYLQ